MRLYEEEEQEERRIFEFYLTEDRRTDSSPIDPKRDRYLMDVGAEHRVRRFFDSIKGFHKVQFWSPLFFDISQRSIAGLPRSYRSLPSPLRFLAA